MPSPSASATSVPNQMLDLFSPTMRLTVYAPIEGQEQLPGVELTTPILRSKDLKHWAPETCLEGWTVVVARGITEESALQMGACKVDDFRFDFFEGGHMDVDFRVSTADCDEAGAGMLWGRQKRKVFVTVTPPEAPAKAIDGSTEAFERDHPGASGQADLLDTEAGDVFAAEHGGQPGPDDDEGHGDDDGSGHTDLDGEPGSGHFETTSAEPAAKPRGRRGRRAAEVE